MRRFFQPIRRGRYLRPDDAAQRLVTRVSAAIVDMPGIDREDNAVFVECHARVAKRAFVAVRARGHMLGARLRPLDGRAVSFARGQRADRHLRVVGDLDAEAAADIVRLHAHLVHPQVECGRQQLNTNGRKRIVAPEVKALVIVVPVCDDGVVFKRRAGEAVHMQVVDVDDVSSIGEGLFHVAVLEDAVPDNVGAHGVVQDHAVGGRDFGVNYSLERFIFDGHKFGGIFGDGGRFGDDGGDRFTLIARAIDRHGVVENLAAGRRANLEERIDELGNFLADGGTGDAGKSSASLTSTG